MPEQPNRMTVEEIVDSPVYRGFRCVILAPYVANEARAIERAASEEMRLHGPLSPEKVEKYLQEYRKLSYAEYCQALAV